VHRNSDSDLFARLLKNALSDIDATIEKAKDPKDDKPKSGERGGRVNPDANPERSRRGVKAWDTIGRGSKAERGEGDHQGEEEDPTERKSPSGDRPEEDVEARQTISTDFVPDAVKKLAQSALKAGGRALVVGGSVRDRVIGEVTPKDIDIEIYGIDPDKIEGMLGKFGRVDAVGKSFGVLKVTLGDEWAGDVRDLDVSVPRRENKTGKGHKGFIVKPDPTMTITEAAKRRDFTMNAMAMDPETGEVFDPFNGMKDIKDKTIRATDPKTFVEDPLRVLRAAQFASRFDMDIDEHTLEISKSMKDEFKELPKERVGVEWEKLLMKGKTPSKGMEILKQTHVLSEIHPELDALEGVEQDPRWHPEGDVWVHTKMVVDAAIESTMGASSEDKKIVMYAALLHDISKPETTETQADGSITSHGHEKAGADAAEKIAVEQLFMSKDDAKKVGKLVERHLAPKLLYKDRKKLGKSVVKRLAKKLEPATIEQLVAVSKADSWGRTTDRAKARDSREEDWLLEQAKEMKVDQGGPKPLLMGRHLQQMKLKPGPVYSRIIDHVFQLQLEGKINTVDEAIAAAEDFIEDEGIGKTLLWAMGLRTMAEISR
jgi:tRNA nucleotidyltransferase (CCA-adding enzyme)